MHKNFQVIALDIQRWLLFLLNSKDPISNSNKITCLQNNVLRLRNVKTIWTAIIIANYFFSWSKQLKFIDVFFICSQVRQLW